MTAAEPRVLFLAKLNLFRVSSSREVSRLWSACGGSSSVRPELGEQGGGHRAEEGRKLTSLMKPSCTSSAASSGMFSSDREKQGERVQDPRQDRSPWKHPAQPPISGWGSQMCYCLSPPEGP